MTNKNYIEQESGRSMVEMLGVLAIIGVLSVGGISGYTTAMNKHKANEILNAAAVRAMAVSTQLQSGVTDPTLGEFSSTEKIGGATFTGVDKVGDNQFKLTFGDKPSPAVLTQMQNIAGDNVGVDGSRLLYNNDLSSGVDGKNTNMDYTDPDNPVCKSGKYGPDCANTCSGEHKTIVDDECVCASGYTEDDQGVCQEEQTTPVYRVVSALEQSTARTACAALGDGWRLASAINDFGCNLGEVCIDKSNFTLDDGTLLTKNVFLSDCYNRPIKQYESGNDCDWAAIIESGSGGYEDAYDPITSYALCIKA